MRDLSVQAANTGGLNAAATANIQKEHNQLAEELTRIAATTTFNGQALLNGAYNGSFQVGANGGEQIAVRITANADGTTATALSAVGLGVAAAGADAGDPDVQRNVGETATLTAIDAALSTVSTVRADLGAKQNRFEMTIKNLNVSVENLTAS
ncbi:flagellin N-terminal helical domain-containing protein, partial [Pseudokineococcus sp. 1T1Z-3]|uniref:flagellin N-terminal helical domain-containing protein n=1 Tax=Pseudokineococcus sp. 1T1Z-3 TaxID=3132745 RepID=UPI0030B657E8